MRGSISWTNARTHVPSGSHKGPQAAKVGIPREHGTAMCVVSRLINWQRGNLEHGMQVLEASAACLFITLQCQW
jgi:hypothetical protein